jgi:hypothetical protein
MLRLVVFCLCSLGALVLGGGGASAQISLSGMVDVVYKRDIAQDSGEREAEINKTFKGGSPFSLVRSRFFVDGEVSQDISVFTTLLYDEAIGRMELEGAYISFKEIRQHPGLNLQVGKMATVFGSFAPRSFGIVNPLIGTPLIYHYFSAIQGGGVPRDNAEQLQHRDAATYRGRGLPMIYDACWNTGVEVAGSWRSFTYAAALTQGALSNPSANGNDGVQFVGRLGAQPSMGLKTGASVAYGPYLNDAAETDRDFPEGQSVQDYKQIIFGLDLEYSRGHFELFGEVVRNHWEVPNLTRDSLANTGGYIEAKYAIFPGFNYALRYGQIAYDEIEDGDGKEPWDYGIKRLESGFEYYIDRNVRAKTVVQLNFKDGPAADDEDHIVGVQLASFFSARRWLEEDLFLYSYSCLYLVISCYLY